MNLLKFLLLFASISFLLSCGNRRKSPQDGDSFLWVEQGKVLAPLIVRSDVSPRTLIAVEDLANYIEKISGGKPKIIKGAPKPIPEKAVWIGFHEEFKTIFPKINFNFQGEEIIIISTQSHLGILGNDALDYGVQDIKMQDRLISNAQKSYGTINSIYTFLNDFLNVRWFWPGELGEDYEVNNTIEIKNTLFRYSPQMTWRSGIIMTSRPGWGKNDFATDLWTQRQRMFYSSELIHGGHPFSLWWEKYAKTNPELFALNEKGNRNPILEPKTVKLCITNEQVAKTWLNEIEHSLKENPFMNIFSVNENDSYNQGHCTCTECRKLDQVSVDAKVKNLSDRHVAFANKLYSELSKKYPNRNDFRVLYFAYGNNRPLPIKAKLYKNIGVVSVANFHLRRLSVLDTNETSVKEYLDWSRMSDLIYWRPNIGNPVGFRWGLPDVAFNQIFDDFKFVADNKCKGVFFDSYPLHWATQGIQYYMAAQLAWNPNLKKEEILNDYFNRLYGDASSEMKTLWKLCEDSRNILLDKYDDFVAKYYVYETYDKSWFINVKKLINSAKQKVNGKDTKYLKRIEFAEFGFTYSEKIVELRALMNEFEKSGNNTEKIDNIWREICSLTEKAPKYAINFKDIGITGDVKSIKQSSKFLVGLLKDSPSVSPKKKKNKQVDIDDEGLE